MQFEPLLQKLEKMLSTTDSEFASSSDSEPGVPIKRTGSKEMLQIEQLKQMVTDGYLCKKDLPNLIMEVLKRGVNVV